ncbi:unnamed protein product [Dicrocoelium dendriticum]|nr:unnamed protein product [Dicrocoelium dendriticum]
MSTAQPNSGGFWNTTKVVCSEDTRKLLKSLIKESNVANSYRHQLTSQIATSESFASKPRNQGRAPQRDVAQKVPRKAKLKSSRPGIRPKHVIQAMLDQSLGYKPPPVPKTAGQAEKLRLAHLMTYGEVQKPRHPAEINPQNGRFAYLRRRIEGTKKLAKDVTGEPNEEDRFSELTREVKERRQFLDQMRVMGKEQQYKNQVETEISQLIHEMEQIDLKLSSELHPAMEANGRVS